MANIPVKSFYKGNRAISNKTIGKTSGAPSKEIPIDSEDSLDSDCDIGNEIDELYINSDEEYMPSSEASDEEYVPLDHTTYISMPNEEIPDESEVGMDFSQPCTSATSHDKTTEIINRGTCDSVNTTKRKKASDLKGKLVWKTRHMEKPKKETEYSGSVELPQTLLDLETPYQFFKYFFSTQLFQHIAEQTILYSSQLRPEKPIDIDADDIERFVGTLLWMSLCHLPHSRLYWSSKFCLSQISEAFPVNKWEEIKRFLHFNDNATACDREHPDFDSLHKIRPFLEFIRTKLLSIPKEEHLSVDEQIIPFKGRSRIKQYIKNKPHKWGYKVYILSGVSGMCYDFEIYTGQEGNKLPCESECGKSGNVVIRLCRTVPRDIKHKVYFDNYFNSPSLQVYLAKQGILAVGTVRPGRVPNINIATDKELRSQGRGAYKENVAIINNCEISLVKWFDNRSVHLLSTYVGSQPVGTINRWFSSEKSYK